eukprot:498300_1
MFSQLLVIATVASSILASQQVATFDGTNDITGTVTVDEGSVTIDLDLSEEPDLPNGFINCTEGGLKYHIHELWTHSDMTEGLISECGASYTGGHYDPWTACG